MNSYRNLNQFEMLRLFYRIFRVSVVFLLVVVGCWACVGAQQNSSVPKIESMAPDRKLTEKNYLKPPFSADEFMGEIVQLVEINHCYTTLPDIEKIFNVHFSKINYSKENDAFLTGLTAGEDWYFDMSLRASTEKFKEVPGYGKGGAASRLRIEWKMNSFGDPLKGECLTPEKLKAIMASHGWDFYGIDKPLPASGSSKVGLMFSRNKRDVIEFEVRRAAEKYPVCAIAVEANGIF